MGRTGSFHLYTDSSMEELASRYVGERKADPGSFRSADLFQPEKIIVPSPRLGQWLERCLADQGIMLANTSFPSVQKFIFQMLTATAPEGAGYRPELFDRGVLLWRIVSVLMSDPGSFPVLDGYIRNGDPGESEELRRYHLANKIARIYDVCLQESPRLLARGFSTSEGMPVNFWELEGTPGDTWQAVLWRRLCRTPGGDLISPADRVMDFLRTDPEKMPDLPGPFTIFGVSSLSPMYLAVIKKLSRTAPVHFFCINPCDALWDDSVRSAWEKGEPFTEPDRVALAFDTTLLGQWAVHQRGFFRLLTDLDPGVDPENGDIAGTRVWCRAGAGRRAVLQPRISGPAEASAPAPGLLQSLQQILHGENSSGLDAIPADDDTLTVHSCHNPLREVEILHDHLLHLIEKHHYSNSDILVAAPDISVFAPYIQAVFDQSVTPPAPDQPSARLGYSISGRSIRQANPLAETFLSLLDIGSSRYELSWVEKILCTPEVRKRFGIGSADIQTIRQWCRDAGIYWGADGDHSRYGFADFENFSWRSGLDRMLLGLAVDDDGDLRSEWEGLTPFSGCEGTENGASLDLLVRFFEQLRETERKIAEPCTMEEWKERLRGIMADFFVMDLDRKAFYRGLSDAVNFLSGRVVSAGCGQMILPLKLVRDALAGMISVPLEDENFFTGRISFCNLHDIRGIPCKVLCLLGMDEKQFPRRSGSDPFNPLRERIENAARSISPQDRYFFMEQLLEVRDYLMIYYRGQDDVADKEFYPSPVVSELCDHIRMKTGRTAVLHALLPYSRRYFRPEGEMKPLLTDLWSYKGEACSICRQLVEEQQLADVLKNLKLGVDTGSDPAEDPENRRSSYRNLHPVSSPDVSVPVTVDLRELELFFYNAGYTFLKNTFGFPREVDFEDARSHIEPLAVDSLSAWMIKDQLSRWLLKLVEERPGTPSEPSDAVRDICWKRLLSENQFPLGSGGLEELNRLIAASWIRNGEYRQAWRHQHSAAKRMVLLEFCGPEAVPVLPETELPRLAVQLQNTMANPPPNCYRKVILQHSLRKLPEDPLILLSYGSSDGKYSCRAFLRHLLLNAAGEQSMTVLVEDCPTGAVSRWEPIESGSARERLRLILTLYLYGKTHPVPLMDRCSVAAASPGSADNCWSEYCKKGYLSEFGDFQLDYARLLWGSPEEWLGTGETPTRAAAVHLAQLCLSGITGSYGQQ